MQANERMMKWMVAAALAGVVKGQSQCSASYLAQINTLCCTNAAGQDECHGGEPTRCNGNCATMFLVRPKPEACLATAEARVEEALYSARGNPLSLASCI
eukprot:COSAG02_NODE_1401_length_12832_cov_20.599702_3_plen_100_part_00